MYSAKLKPLFFTLLLIFNPLMRSQTTNDNPCTSIVMYGLYEYSSQQQWVTNSNEYQNSICTAY